MKLISWNVNGIRACVGKNFMEFFNEEMQIYFVCKKLNYKKIKLIYN